jgi:hypothetical protein
VCARGMLLANARARVRMLVASATERAAWSVSAPAMREARVSRKAVANATRAEDVNKESALRSRATLGALTALRISRSWVLSAQQSRRRGHAWEGS